MGGHPWVAPRGMTGQGGIGGRACLAAGGGVNRRVLRPSLGFVSPFNNFQAPSGAFFLWPQKLRHPRHRAPAWLPSFCLMVHKAIVEMEYCAP